MNSFVAFCEVKEIDIKSGSYSTNLWVDGKKTEEKVNVNTYRGRINVAFGDNSYTFEVNASDIKPFVKKGEKPNMLKSYDNINKFMSTYDRMAKDVYVKITGEAEDAPYWSVKESANVELMNLRADFITVLNDKPEELACYLNATTFVLGADEDENSDMYKLKCIIAPKWGKKYFPLRSSKNDKFAYATEEAVESIKELVSEDGDSFDNSILLTYKLCFKHMGGSSKRIEGKGFGDDKSSLFASRGWDVPYFTITAGKYIEPIMDVNDEDEEICTNAKEIIFKKDIKPAMNARKEMLNGLKEKREAWEKKKNNRALDDLVDNGDIPF